MRSPPNFNPAIQQLMMRISAVETRLDGIDARLADQLADVSAEFGQLAATLASDVTALQQQITADEATLGALGPRVDSLEATAVSVATASTPTLAALATKDITLTLSRPMPTTTYPVRALADPAVVGKLTPTVKAQTKTTVTVTVSALVAVAASSVTVIAWPATS